MSLFARAQSYVGMPYLEGAFDCADLAVKVQWELFGRLVSLPAHHGAGARTQGALIAKHRDEVADRMEQAQTGCAALLWEPDGATNRLWHIGTVFVHEGEVWVLHNSLALGSAALQRLNDMKRWGMRLEGFYAWRGAV
jgi:hypothetical protein